MAYRVFPSGQVPTAEVLQKYLMNQVVIGCTSTSRPPTPIDGMTVFETDTGAFRVWRGGVWAMIAKVGQWDDDGDLHVSGAIDATGGITATGALAGATMAATGEITSGGLMVSRLVKGKVAGTQVDTTISASTDTNLTGANVQNVPVVSGRAYKTTIAIDYHGATGAIDRLEFKLWNGTVGGTQLGGTVRHEMSGGVGSSNRNVVLVFVWEAASTTTIANINLSATVTGTATGWASQINAAFVHLVEEIGLASTITNL